MKCYWSVDYECWIKGFIHSDSRRILLSDNGGQQQVALYNTEVLFGTNYVSITGYVRKGLTDNAFNLERYYVLFTKPKEHSNEKDKEF